MAHRLVRKQTGTLSGEWEVALMGRDKASAWVSTGVQLRSRPWVSTAEIAMRAESGRLSPAMARRMVVLPLPDGPKRTVHAWVRENFTST